MAPPSPSNLAIEAALVSGAALVLLVYHAVFLRELKRQPWRTAIGEARLLRRAWVKDMVAGHKDILAVQTLRNWSQSASFLASSAILLAIGMLSFLMASDRVSSLVHLVNLWGDLSEKLLTAKLMLLVVNFLVSFFAFSIAIRHYNYAALAINTPQEGAREPIEAVALRHLERGANHYTVGMRGFYLALPLALWILGPLWMFIGTLALVYGLYRHDHAG
ncbi:MAG: DUF599 domain-containing protein [Pseudomonadota bacterium]